MPIVRAFPLGLILAGTTSVILADGSTAPKLTALGTVTVDTESRAGIILLAPASNEILLGMEFLKTFGKVLLVHQNKAICALVDEKDVDQLFEAAAKAIADQEAAKSQPAQIAPTKNATDSEPTPKS